MIAERTPEEWNELRAAIDILGLDDQWRQAGTICEEIHTCFAELKAGMAQKESVPQDWLRKVMDYIPLLRKKKEVQAAGGMKTPDELLLSLKACGH